MARGRTEIPIELRTAALYAAISGAWITLSDLALEGLASDTRTLTELQNWKGWFFVAATTVLVYGLVRRYRVATEAAHRRVAESEEQLRDLVTYAGEGIMRTEVSGAILSANPAACRLLGRSEAEICAAGRSAVVVEDDPRLAAALAKRASDGAFEGVLTYRRADGSTFEGETSSRVYTDTDGTRRSIVLFRDISSRVSAERRLHESEARHRALFEAHHMPALVIDPATGRIVDANPAAARFYGWDIATLRTMQVSGLNTLSAEAVREEMARALAESRQWFRFSHRTASGEVRAVDVHSVPIAIDGRTFLLSVVHDRTTLAGIEIRLARRDRLYAMLSETNQALLRSSDREALLGRICEIAVSPGGFRFAWIGMVRPDGSVPVDAKAGDDVGYTDALRVSVDEREPNGRGPIGFAVREGRPVVANDFRAASADKPWAELGARAQVRSSAAFPIRCRGTVVGTLNLYSGDLDFFQPDEIATLTDITADLSYGLDRLEDEQESTELRRELDRAAARFRFAVEGAGHGVWEWDVATGHVTSSGGFVQQLGFDRADFPSEITGWLGLVHPEDSARVLAAIAEVTSGEAPTKRAECRIRRRDGTWACALLSGAALEYGPDGRALRVVGTTVDLTEVKRAEAAQRETEARARKMVELSSDLVILLQGDRIAYVNPAGVRMMQALSANAIIGCSVHDVFHPFSLPLIESRLALLRETPGSTVPPVRERLVTRASEVLDVETTAVSFVQDGETIIQLTCRDLTARLAIERELAELRARLAQAPTDAGPTA